jgi:type VI secretion system protein ImpM
MTAADPGTLIGLYGKLPARRDFVQRALPSAFLDPWDAWLRAALAHSQERLNGKWLECYLTSPIWRFALSPGLCGKRLALGVLMPSVDGVGRHYPLTVVALSAEADNPFAAADAADRFLTDAEALALSALTEALDLHVFDDRLSSLHVSLNAADRLRPLPADPDLVPNGSLGWRLPAATLGELGHGLYPHLLHDLMVSRLGGYSLWWTAGSDDVSPSFLVQPGLPAPKRFLRFLCRGETVETAPAGAVTGSVAP